MGIYDVFYDLQGLGFYDYVLPFLLIFTIIFAILEKTLIFGKEPGTNEPRRNINFVLAFVIALIVIIQTEIVALMSVFMSKMALFILIAIIFILTVGVFGHNPEKGFSGGPLAIGFILTIFAIIWALNPDLTSLGFPNWFLPTEQDRTIVIAIGIFALVLWMIFGRKSGQDGYSLAKFAKDLEGRQ